MWDSLVWRVTAKLFGGDRASRLIGVKVGQGCRICPCGFGSEPWLVSIGDRVTVAPGVAFLTHDGATWLFRDDRGRRYRYARIEVGSDVFIGANAILMPGVRIGNRVIIGAGSVVTKSIPDGLVVAGNPSRVLGNYSEFERKALGAFSAADNMSGPNWRARVDSIVEKSFRPDMGSEKKCNAEQSED